MNLFGIFFLGAFSSWFEPLTKLMISIGGVVALFAALKIYNNYQLGRTDLFADTSRLFLACIFLIIIPIALRAIF